MSRHHIALNPSTRATAPRNRRAPLAVAAIAVLALVGAACGDDSSAGGSTIDAIDITSPTDGTTVGESFDIDVDTGSPIGEPDTGRQHLHVYYDVEPGGEDYDIVYELPFTTRELSPGEHTVHVAVANGDHSLTDVRQQLTVMVDPEAGASDDAPPPTRDPDSSGAESPPGY